MTNVFTFCRHFWSAALTFKKIDWLTAEVVKNTRYLFKKCSREVELFQLHIFSAGRKIYAVFKSVLIINLVK